MARYLRNCWYVAAHAREVTRKPLCRTLLGGLIRQEATALTGQEAALAAT